MKDTRNLKKGTVSSKESNSYNSEITEIVSKTMNDYIILKCQTHCIGLSVYCKFQKGTLDPNYDSLNWEKGLFTNDDLGTIIIDLNFISKEETVTVLKELTEFYIVRNGNTYTITNF